MKKIILIQVSDYRNHYFTIKSGKQVAYIFQEKFIEFTSGLLNKYGISDVCIVSIMGTEQYDQVLPNGIRAVGMSFDLKAREQSKKRLNEFIDMYQPTQVIVQVPLIGLIRHCIKRKISTYVMIADSFTGNGLRGFIWSRVFGCLLNNKFVKLVSNHNYPASNLLKSFGVNPKKIVPWDFAWQVKPKEGYPIKNLVVPPKNWKFFYAGRILAEKGVGDIIQAMAFLKQQSVNAIAVFAGAGNIPGFEKQAADLGISERISFLGTVGHDQVLKNMFQADAVIVPSRIKSSEGMPCTIYEAFSVRTPLILSDHPMFRDRIKNGVFFKQGDPRSLSEAMCLLINDPRLYNELSANSYEALGQLIVPFDYMQIIDHWLSGQEEDKKWLIAHSLQKLNKIN